MGSSESETAEKLKAPYGNVVWYEKFFGLIRSKSWEKIDAAIIEANIIRGPNATMLFNGLRFLGLVEENGKTTLKLESLRVRGEEFKESLKEVVEEAYVDLLKTVALEQAKTEHVLNYFMKTYLYGEAAARQAMKIFFYLAQEAGIPLSQDLISAKTEKPPKSKSPTEGRKKETESLVSPLRTPKGIHLLKDGDITIWLPEGEKKAAIKAKDLIDYYINHLED
jgi:hypothetical protein